MSDALTAHVYGAVRLSTARGVVDIPRGLQAITAFLLLNPSHPHRRDLLATRFWGDRDEQHARRCLNTALWRLRDFVEPQGVSRGAHLVADINRIALLTGAQLQVDAMLMDAAYVLSQRHSPRDADPAMVAMLEQAVLLCAGSPLDGVEGDWTSSFREQLSRQQAYVTRYLMTCRRERKDFEGALGLGRRLLEADPYREDIHRDVMGLLLACDDRAGALRQFEQCKTLLAEDLGVEPSPETTALYHSAVGRPAGVSWPLAQIERAPSSRAEPRRRIERHLRLAHASAQRAAFHIEQARRLEQDLAPDDG